MTSFKATDIAAAAKRIAAAAPEIAAELNTADSLLGDGDTGGMLARLVEAITDIEIISGDDIGATLSRYARAVGRATGSSLGTLLMCGLLAVSRGAKGRTSIPLAELSSLLTLARNAMLERGQCALGDKTMVDAVEALRAALAGVDDSRDLALRGATAVNQCLATFRNQPCRIGRARMFGEKSRGLDDPGMLAIARLVHAMIAHPSPIRVSVELAKDAGDDRTFS